MHLSPRFRGGPTHGPLEWSPTLGFSPRGGPSLAALYLPVGSSPSRESPRLNQREWNLALVCPNRRVPAWIWRPCPVSVPSSPWLPLFPSGPCFWLPFAICGVLLGTEGSDDFPRCSSDRTTVVPAAAGVLGVSPCDGPPLLTGAELSQPAGPCTLSPGLSVVHGNDSFRGSLQFQTSR